MPMSLVLLWPLELAVPIGLWVLSLLIDAWGYPNLAWGQQDP